MGGCRASGWPVLGRPPRPGAAGWWLRLCRHHCVLPCGAYNELRMRIPPLCAGTGLRLPTWPPSGAGLHKTRKTKDRRTVIGLLIMDGPTNQRSANRANATAHTSSRAAAHGGQHEDEVDVCDLRARIGRPDAGAPVFSRTETPGQPPAGTGSEQKRCRRCQWQPAGGAADGRVARAARHLVSHT
jgi:hypothetical protein